MVVIHLSWTALVVIHLSWTALVVRLYTFLGLHGVVVIHLSGLHAWVVVSYDFNVVNVLVHYFGVCNAPSRSHVLFTLPRFTGLFTCLGGE